MAKTDAQKPERLRAIVPVGDGGKRLDAVLAVLFPEYSRSRLQRWVREGHVRIGAVIPKCSDKVTAGAMLEMDVPEANEARWEPQSLPLDVLYEDDAILVIDKPPGLVVHPGAGNPEGTLLNALLHHAPSLKSVPRAGIVHRLDKDTSGLLVVARTDAARLDLIRELQARRVKREYLAVVHGVVHASGTIEASIGRHPLHRTRMSVHPRGKAAVTHYFIKATYRAHTLLTVRLESGRTHQIRVHMDHIGHPVVGDPVYGARRRKAPPSASVPALVGEFPRQALHAVKLGLLHPVWKNPMEWSVPPPADMEALIQALEATGC